MIRRCHRKKNHARTAASDRTDWTKAFRSLDLRDLKHSSLLVQLLDVESQNLGEPPSSFSLDLAAQRIAHAEEWISRNQKDGNFGGGTTYHPDFPPGPKRLRKHADILEHLLSNPRRSGGSLPNTPLQSKNQLLVVTGPPASGKSTISEKIADRIGAVIVDPDDAKRELPEYSNGINAKFIHDESSDLTKGINGLLRCALDRRLNIVLPTVGGEQDKPQALFEGASSRGYEVHLLNVRCRAEVAAMRSLKRFIEDGRYVELALILREIGESPEKVNKGVRKRLNWAGYAAYSTMSARKSNPALEQRKFICDIKGL